MRDIKLSPSVFAAHLSTMQDQIAELEKAGCDYLHVDVMDGRFVEHMGFGPYHVGMLKEMTSMPLDVHLMVERPEDKLDAILEAGADIVTVHQESTTRLLACIQKIKSAGARAGVVLGPATPPEMVEYLLDDVDMVLLMTINMGEPTRQHFLTSMLPKIERVNKMIGERPIDLEVDGSIDDKTIKLARSAGANVFVSGGYLFKDIPHNVAALRDAVR